MSDQPPPLWSLVEQWREPRSLHPYRDEKMCASELESLIRRHIDRLARVEGIQGEKLSAEEILQNIIGIPTDGPR